MKRLRLWLVGKLLREDERYLVHDAINTKMDELCSPFNLPSQSDRLQDWYILRNVLLAVGTKDNN